MVSHGPPAGKSPSLPLDPIRGLRAAVPFGLAGAIAPVAVLYGLFALHWWLNGAPALDRRFDIARIRTALPGPVVGCATIGACAAWATYAPRGSFRFAGTLAVVAAISLGLWGVLGWASIWDRFTPPRIKGVRHPMFYPSELVLLMSPPIVSAALVAALRAWGMPRPSSGPGTAPSIPMTPAQGAT